MGAAALAVAALATGTTVVGSARARPAAAAVAGAEAAGAGAASAEVVGAAQESAPDAVGVAQVIRPPIGNVDVLAPLGAGQLLLAGWAADPDEGDAHPRVDVYVGGPVGTGTGRSYGPVDRYRPDVSAVHAGRTDRGFAIALTDLAPGPLTVCAYGVGRIESASALLGCRTATVPARGSHDPFGTLDLVEVPAERAVRAQGWAVDPDEPTAPVEVVVQALQTDPAGSALLGVPVDACGGGSDRGGCVPDGPFLADDDKDATTTVARPDVAAAFPGVGGAQGFDHTVTRREYRPSPLPFDTARLEAGMPTRVCAWARNRGPGADALLGCRWVDVPAPSTPVLDGKIYVPRASTGPLPAGTVAVEGWLTRAGSARVPETSDLGLEVTVGGPRGLGELRDLGQVAALPAANGAFATTLSGVAAGRRLLCAYARDLTTARTVLISCWYATVT